jgi:hypothetical protein
VNPGAVFSERGHFEEILVETPFFNCSAKGWFMESRRARAHYYSVKVVLLDIFYNLFLAQIRTSILAPTRINNIRKSASIFSNFFDIY